jgi:hypothetical protein
LINRAALIVRPKQPFIEWARSIEDEIVPQAEGEQTVYLIPEHDTPKEFEKILKEIWSYVFESQLCGWHVEEDAWPKNRTYSMFKLWFQIECHTVIEDLCGDPIEDDEIEYG